MAYKLNARDALKLIKDHPVAVEKNATLNGTPVEVVSVWLLDPATNEHAWYPLFVHVNAELYNKLLPKDSEDGGGNGSNSSEA